MESVALNTIKKELNFLPPEQLAELCLRLSRYKRENKELLSYLLFEAHDEAVFIAKVKDDMDDRTRAEEQQRLEECMGDHVENGCNIRAGTNGQEHETELRDR